ncbi:hypothetical protein HanXRQr2_Chr08g0335621 [Helianthus annuus]|uniref:Uncharacterized protein n=1 Tax=Helianthus annuus TaxID=4232 RepID=A0A9K3IEA7_HELAN|nr:hypothetical protein HanXRQr2_Chr08g0335621 [Helianthus annuus]KAJ0538638.1 hypothetical protein HanHA300_Chr08g0277241 [Helianthus annuus]KAJ0553268.1 hypothetical protein HanHA89_Chr08g0294541 [Helianthus annuus]KAJ0901346.1 hypothetical protein HanPSC8_Chr08g0324261 [Helianthus annuus]
MSMHKNQLISLLDLMSQHLSSNRSCILGSYPSQGNAQNIMMFFSVSKETRLSRPQMPNSTPPCNKMKMII